MFNAVLPLVAAVLQASSVTLDKVILSIRRVGFRTYTGISFPLIFLINLSLFLIFRPPFSLGLFSGLLGLLILVSIAMSAVTNLIFYRALDGDKLSEIQTIGLLRSIPAIIYTSLIFSDERNLVVIIPALIASFAILWSHWEKHHFILARKTWPYLIWSVTVLPFGAPISKALLASWNPIALEAVRTAVIALIVGSLFFQHTKAASSKAFKYLIFTNILTTVAWLLYLFSIQKSGVIYTILIFSLQPLLVYLSSLFVLKEKPEKKKIIAFVIVLASIVTGQLLLS